MDNTTKESFDGKNITVRITMLTFERWTNLI